MTMPSTMVIMIATTILMTFLINYTISSNTINDDNDNATQT